MNIKCLALIGGVAVSALIVPVKAADVGYPPDQYSYDYCLELAREEAGANLGRIYLYPEIIAGDEAALSEKTALKEHKKATQQEQRKEKCI